MKPGIRRPPIVSQLPRKPAKRKRRQPLPGWLAAAIFFGGLLIVGAIFAFRLSQAGYEGPDKYPEFRELKKQFQADQAAEAEKARAAEEQAGKSLDVTSPDTSGDKSELSDK